MNQNLSDAIKTDIISEVWHLIWPHENKLVAGIDDWFIKKNQELFDYIRSLIKESRELKWHTFQLAQNLIKVEICSRVSALHWSDDWLERIKNNPSILIVDDDTWNLALFRDMLKTTYSSIRVAKSWDDALKLIAKSKPDIILLDIMMEWMDWIETCKIIRKNEEFKHIPIIFITAHWNEDVEANASEAWWNDFITKPATSTSIITRIKNQLNIIVKQKEIQLLLERITQQNISLGLDVETSHRSIDSLSKYDLVTSLNNRQEFERLAEMAFKDNERYWHSFWVMVLKVDKFTDIKQWYWKEAEDLFLLHIADNLKELFSREGDIIARIDWNTFAFLWLFDSIESAKSGMPKIAQKIFERFKNNDFVFNDKSVNITLKIWATLPSDDISESLTIIQNADSTANSLNNRTWNQFDFSEPSLSEAAKKRLDMESLLNNSIQENRLELYYQAQKDLKTWKIVWAEALIRMRDRNWKMIFPDDFIPAAENSGKIIEMWDWVILEACQKILKWDAMGLSLENISVNVSTLQVLEPDFIEKLKKVLELTGIDPSRLIIEITESIAEPERIEEIIEKIIQVKKLWCKVSMDDFGTGYSSLSQLVHLPLDELKIDKSFIQKMLDDEKIFKIVETIMSMAKGLKIGTTVSEWIETDTHEEAVVNLWWNIWQGYWISKPIPESDFVPFAIKYNTDTKLQSNT